MLKTVGNPSTRYGDQTIVDGNLVIATAGKGIDFSGSPHLPNMTSELLDDYEEGGYSIVDESGAGLTLNVSEARYTKIGRAIYVQFIVTYPVTADVNVAALSLPFVADGYGQFTGRFGSNVIGSWQCQSGQAKTILHTINSSGAVINAALSGQYVIISGVYMTLT